jgi:hypothetical protein
MKSELKDLRFSRLRLWRMSFSGMWSRFDFVRTDVSEERIAAIMRAKRFIELGPSHFSCIFREGLRRITNMPQDSRSKAWDLKSIHAECELMSVSCPSATLAEVNIWDSRKTTRCYNSQTLYTVTEKETFLVVVAKTFGLWYRIFSWMGQNWIGLWTLSIARHSKARECNVSDTGAVYLG